MNDKMNEKIKELIDWCRTETDICIEIRKSPSCSSQEKIFQSGKKMILDAVKDKLCSIYEDDKPKCKGYVYTEKGKFEITEIEDNGVHYKVYYKNENGVERAVYER